ncbi:unnamed protein product [Leuciscus chuanchicus]
MSQRQRSDCCMSLLAMEPLACQLSSAAHTFRAGIEENTTAHLVPSDGKQVYDTWRKLNFAFPLLEWISTHALVVTDYDLRALKSMKWIETG